MQFVRDQGWLQPWESVPYKLQANLNSIIQSNVAVDTSFLHTTFKAEYHFDDESFAAAKSVLKNLDSSFKSALATGIPCPPSPWPAPAPAPLPPHPALAPLGSLTHVLQDFYAHTNWVEMWGDATPQINSEVVYAPSFSNLCSAYQRRCTYSDMNLNDGGRTYYAGHATTACLTSGYCGSTPGSVLPAGLCGHGPTGPNGASLICTAPSADYSYTTMFHGINKDYAQGHDNSRFDLHVKAASLAREHTLTYLNVVAAAVTMPVMKKLLMDLPQCPSQSNNGAEPSIAELLNSTLLVQFAGKAGNGESVRARLIFQDEAMAQQAHSAELLVQQSNGKFEPLRFELEMSNEDSRHVRSFAFSMPAGPFAIEVPEVGKRSPTFENPLAGV